MPKPKNIIKLKVIIHRTSFNLYETNIKKCRQSKSQNLIQLCRRDFAKMDSIKLD